MTINPYVRPEGRPCQGSLYCNIILVVPGGTLRFDKIPISTLEMPYAVAMSQECDLVQDNKARATDPSQKPAPDDKVVPSVLICPGYQSSLFREGRHLEGLGMKMEKYTSKPWAVIKSNSNPRFHFMCQWAPFHVPELVVDFKHFQTIPTEVLRNAYGGEEHHIARLACPYREELSQRFASYLARIGVPVPHGGVEKAMQSCSHTGQASSKS